MNFTSSLKQKLYFSTVKKKEFMTTLIITSETTGLLNLCIRLLYKDSVFDQI